jgi:hypothetical protein
VASTFALLIALPASFAQAPADPSSGMPDTQQAAPLLSPDQLNNLVAPVALYPDPLLSQVLAASTYPLEIVEAQQWLGQNSNLQGSQLMDAAKRQNWDPSVQALVAFPDAIRLLANDIRWTTDLGNAFLAQQADVMSAVQRMRARARANGRLTTTPQQVVTMDAQGGQNEIQIEPADPQVIYVPIYSPSYVWGTPVWGGYYDMWYPSGFGWGFGYGPGIYMSSFYPDWIGWGGWGWGCGWFGRSLFLNTGFFNRYGFRGGDFGRYGGFSGRGFGGRTPWAHNPGHRLGIPYSNRNVASRFGGSRMNGGQFARGTRSGGGRSGASGDWQRFGGGNRSPSAGRPDARGSARSGASGFQSGNRGGTGSYQQPSQNYAAKGGSRNYRAPAQRSSGYGSAQVYRSSPSSGRSVSPGYSAPRSSSSPRVSSGGSGPSGGRSVGNSGSSGSRSSGGGGRRR